MANIDMVRIRAKIEIGNSLTIETPYIQSFNVRKTRGQTSTFDASLKVKYEDIDGNNIGGEVRIYAGEDTPEKIFTGIVRKANISPCWDDPGFVFMNISGADPTIILQGKKYTRRCRATNGTWVSIDGAVRPGLRDGKFAFKKDTVMIDGGEVYDKVIARDMIKESGAKVAKPPKTKTPPPFLTKITMKPNTDEEVV